MTQVRQGKMRNLPLLGMRPLCSISSKLKRRSSEGEWANAQEAPYRQRGQFRHISVLR